MWVGVNIMNCDRTFSISSSTVFFLICIVYFCLSSISTFFHSLNKIWVLRSDILTVVLGHYYTGPITNWWSWAMTSLWEKMTRYILRFWGYRLFGMEHWSKWRPSYKHMANDWSFCEELLWGVPNNSCTGWKITLYSARIWHRTKNHSFYRAGPWHILSRKMQDKYSF